MNIPYLINEKNFSVGKVAEKYKVNGRRYGIGSVDLKGGIKNKHEIKRTSRKENYKLLNNNK